MVYQQFMKREVFTFRRFSRKGYALFAVLGREVRVGVLGVATLAAAAPRLAQAAAELPTDSAAVAASTGDTLSLAAAVVEASPSVTRVADASALLVQVLTREDVAAAAVTSVNDVLKLATGTDVRQRGGFGMQTDISINGGTFDQVAFFVNGFPINNPQTGHNAADFPLTLADIERIEVLEGAAASIFGSQAFSGVVNVITRTAAREEGRGAVALDASLSGGSYGTLLAEARAAIGGSGERASSSLSAAFRRSDGAVENSAFRGGKAFWQGRFDGKGFTLRAQAGATLNDFGANTFYSAAYPNQWEATRRYHVGVRGETAGRVRFVPEVSWLRNADHFQLIRHSATGENYHRGDVFAGGFRAYAGWRADKAAMQGTLSAGAEIRLEEIYSSNLGRPMDEANCFSHYTRHDSRTNVALNLGHSVRWQGWTLDLSAAAQHNSSTGRRFRIYPGATLAYSVREGGGHWRFMASWQRTFRLPTFTDLYYKSPTQEGNTGLRAEENTSVRVGAEHKSRTLDAGVHAFFNKGTNMIDWVMFAPDDVFHATAFRLSNMGASASFAADLHQLLGARQPLRRIALSYAYIHQHRRDRIPYFKSNYALEYLRHKFTARLEHTLLIPRLSVAWALRVQRREGNYLVYANGAPTGELRPYGTHAILDCKVRWKAARYELYADLQNLTRTRYYDLGNVPQPRFFLLLGGSLRL